MHDSLFRRGRIVFAALAVVTLLAGCMPIQPEAGTVPAPAAEAIAAPTEEVAGGEGAAEGTTVEETAMGSIPVATFTITAEGVTLPDEVMSGIVAVEFVNEGGPQGTPDIGRLVDGATVEQLMEALGRMETEGPGPALELVKLYGHNDPAEGDQLIYDIQPGNHVVLVWPGEQGGGMPTVVEFTTGQASPAEAPVAGVEVQLDDFAFVMPDEIAAGPQLWQIENTGEQWHEMIIVQLSEGVTVDDVLAMLMTEGEPQGEPPFQDFGGWLPISEGNRAWGTFDLPPGEYTVICFLPDIMADMAPHVVKGMVRQLVVN
jgi:hypothetical protein